MLALCVGVDYWYFTAADAGLLWEEREPALFVYCSDLEDRGFSLWPSVFRRISGYRIAKRRSARVDGRSCCKASTASGPFEGPSSQHALSRRTLPKTRALWRKRDYAFGC